MLVFWPCEGAQDTQLSSYKINGTRNSPPGAHWTFLPLARTAYRLLAIVRMSFEALSPSGLKVRFRILPKRSRKLVQSMKKRAQVKMKRIRKTVVMMRIATPVV